MTKGRSGPGGRCSPVTTPPPESRRRSEPRSRHEHCRGARIRIDPQHSSPAWQAEGVLRSSSRCSRTRSCERLPLPPAPGRRRDGDSPIAHGAGRGHQPSRVRPERERCGKDGASAIHARHAQTLVRAAALRWRRHNRCGGPDEVERVVHHAPPRQSKSRGGENARGPDEIQPLSTASVARNQQERQASPGPYGLAGGRVQTRRYDGCGDVGEFQVVVACIAP